MERKIKASVVIVDDDNMLRDMLKLILRGEDFSVVGEASNGQDAITQCEKLKPQLVLLDITMPKMDGLQALEKIRKVCPEAIVLMISADATMDRVAEAIKKGAAGFLVKPLKAVSVIDRINLILKDKKTS
jgi:two-component system chemotaxis response regulator CheY